MEDASEGGYGAVIPAVAGDWVEVGSLIGIEVASIREWRIGAIRRVNRLEGSQQRVGLQLLGSGVALVTLLQNGFNPDASASPAERAKSECAVLITRDPERQTQVEIIARSGMFTNLNYAEMSLGDKVFGLKPAGIVERSSRGECVAFQVIDVV